MFTGAGQKLTREELELRRKRDELETLRRKLARREEVVTGLRDRVLRFEKTYTEVLLPRIEELDTLKRRLSDPLSGMEGPGSENGSTAGFRPEPEDDETVIAPEQSRETYTTPVGRIKELYRKVAKLIHPDLSTDDEERKWRQRLMAEANSAYAREDVESLQAILREWENGPEANGRDGLTAELGLLLHRIFLMKEKIRTVEAEIELLRNSDLYRLMTRIEKARSEGIDLLAEMASRLDEDIALTRGKLRDIVGSPAGEGGVGIHTVSFPKDYSLGTLYIRKRSSNSFLDWRVYGDAMGTVSVPSDRSLRLDVQEGFADTLAPLRRLDEDDLQALFLRGAKDRDLRHLHGLTGLRELYLSGRGVSDTGLENLRPLRQLNKLYLYETRVTDGGLEQLADLTTLRALTFSDTRVTETGLNRLKRALPTCRIIILQQNRGKGEKSSCLG